MKKLLQKTLVFALPLFFTLTAFSQGEAMQWRFGYFAGLDFNSNPPAVVATNTMYSVYSSVSVADAAGNLLFYSNGATVWDATNATMANGSGLYGNSSNSQIVMSVKQPGNSNIYFLFTSNWNSTGTSGLYYSVIDMSLASGNGSVTAKNIPLAVGIPSTTTGKLTATRHCNGTDVWLVGREWFANWNGGTTNTGTFVANNSFRSFLVSAAGVNTTAVISTPLTYTYSGNFGFYNNYGTMKVSPNGKKLGVAIYEYNNNNSFNNSFELYDFDNTTGVVSNPLALLANNTIYNYSWGCEFSPDGSKFYGTQLYSGNLNDGGELYQWDLCAGSPAAVVASMYTVATNPGTGDNFAGLQLAPDGKIYMARSSSTYQALDVIDNPNGLGAACNYTAGAQSIAPRWTYYSLPNFMNSYLYQHPAPTPFTHTVSPLYGCQTASFNTVYVPGTTTMGCAGYTLANLTWNFGDPASGAANTSTLINPSHNYSALGTYTAQLILYYSCGGGTDTIRQIVNVNTSCVSVSSTSITCANPGSATVTLLGGIGPFSYTWMPTTQTGSTASGFTASTYTLAVHDSGNNFTYTATTTFSPAIPLTGNVAYSNNVTCNGASTGTALVTNIAGGSGSVNYIWTDGVHSYTNPAPTNLSAGVWSLTVSDNLTSCQLYQSFFITQPPASSLTISSPSTCAGTTVTLTGSASGGTGAHTYSWMPGPATNTLAVSQSTAGISVYTLTSTDANNCTVSTTTSVTFAGNPTLSVSNVSICPLQTGTLNVSGAGSYIWSSAGGTVTGNSFTNAPSVTTQFTVTGSALGCTAAATASIILKPVPVPTLSSNSPVCQGGVLTINTTGGTAYLWGGPNAFISANANSTISPAPLNASGVYNVTVTAANSCTAAASQTILVNPLPVISVSGNSLICNGSSITQTASGANTYSWSTGATTASVSLSPSVNAAFTVSGTDANGCAGTVIKTITVNTLPSVTISGNGTLCAGSSVTQTASGASTYSWSTGATTASVSLSPSANAAFTVSGTDINGCMGLAIKTITVNALPVITISGNNAFCAGSASTLTAGGANTYSWSNSVIAASVSLSPSVASVYTVSGTDTNGCVNSASISVTVNPVPSLIVYGNSTVCAGAGLTQTITGAASYSWSTGALTSTVLLSPTGNTIYTVTGTDINGCIASLSEPVTVKPLPVLITVLSNSVLCLGETGTISITGGVSWLWNTGATTANIPVTPSITTTYSVTATGGNGCSKSATAIQYVNACTSIAAQAPEAFLPTVWPNPNNGVFDLMVSSAEGLPVIEIYNSLGLLIKHEDLAAEHTQLNLGHAANGLYYIIINTGKNRYVTKMIKE